MSQWTGAQLTQFKRKGSFPQTDVDAAPRHCAIPSFTFPCVQVSRYNMLSLIIPFPTLILWQKMNRTQLNVSVMPAYPLLHCKHGASVYLAGFTTKWLKVHFTKQLVAQALREKLNINCLPVLRHQHAEPVVVHGHHSEMDLVGISWFQLWNSAD